MKKWALLFMGAVFFFLSCGQGEPIKFNLPKEVPDSLDGGHIVPKASRLVILVFGSRDIYAYTGAYIRSGKKYSYRELTDLLNAKKTDTNLMVVIKPAKSCTYKNTVDMLDEMKIADVKRYALVDITDQEESYLAELR
jgi:biopolymer transport protein ExbD